MIKKEIGTLLSFIAEGLVLFDKRGHITLVNPHATLLLDYTSEELMGKYVDNVFDIYIDNERVEKNKITKTIFTEGKPFNTPQGHTIYFKSQDGRKFPVFISAKSFEASGEKSGVLVFRDITVEKELENYKINTAKRLATLTPILQRTSTGNLSIRVKVPPTEDEFTELFVGINLMMDDLEELDKTRNKSEADRIEGITRAEREKRMLSEGYSRELEIKVREKIRELNQSKVHIETLIENLTSGLIEFDSEHRLVRMNKAAEELLGIRREQVLGRIIDKNDAGNKELLALMEVATPESYEEVKKVSENVTSLAGDVYEIKIRDPEEKNLQVSTIPITEHAMGGGGIIKVIRDITRESLISKSKSEFISIAAHQLRTPLSAIKWALQMLIKGGENKFSDFEKDLLAKSFDTNDRMISLVSDMLDVSRIDEGRFDYDFKKNNAADLIRSLVANSEIAAKEKNINIVFNSDKLAESFIFDVNKLSVAVQNLLENAVKYTLRNGKIIIDLKKDGDYAKIEISDTGVGIPKNQIDRTFSKFFRAENVKKIETGGSGLGLFIVKSIVDKHGGKISVESEENEGTTFSLKVPLKGNEGVK